jgi:hypothetical protein
MTRSTIGKMIAKEMPNMYSKTNFKCKSGGNSTILRLKIVAIRERGAWANDVSQILADER